jgi:hypothetical protein
VGGLVPVAHVAEYPARVRDSVSAVAQQLDKIAVPPGEAIVQFERFAGTLCGARGACQSGRMNQVALPFSGGSATGLSGTDAWLRAAAGDGNQRTGSDIVPVANNPLRTESLKGH